MCGSRCACWNYVSVKGMAPFCRKQSLSVLWLPTKFITLRKRQARILAELVRRLKTASPPPRTPTTCY